MQDFYILCRISDQTSLPAAWSGLNFWFDFWI